MTDDLEGTVALVTGGTRGIGRAIAKRLRTAGAEVAVCGRRQPDALPDGITFYPADVRDPDAVSELFARLRSAYGRLDLLVNNAGGSPYAEAATASPRFSRAIIELNLLAPLYCAQAANLIMREQDGGGSIVNIGSVSGVRPSPGTAAYGAAKAGLSSLTRSLAAEWAPKVRVNCLVVGLVLTEDGTGTPSDGALGHYGDESSRRALTAAIPMGRLASPDEIADPVLFLASAGARYITGADLQIHGGGERPPHLHAAESRTDHPKVN
ncbi:SDR family oxidoreductase [Streptomyces sp. NPDC020096]